jgi:hypothetical protein
MVIFLLSALAAYLLYGPIAAWWAADLAPPSAPFPQRDPSPGQPRASNTLGKVFGWIGYSLRFTGAWIGYVLHVAGGWIRHYHRAFFLTVFVAALLFGLGYALFALITGSREAESFVLIRRYLSAPEADAAVFGALAGVICRAFPRWRIALGLGGTVGVSMFAGALAGMMGLAVLEPSLSRLIALETPYAKFQFATPQSERQLQLDIARDLSIYQGLLGITENYRIVQLECGYAAIEAGGFAEYETSPAQYSIRHAFESALNLRHEFVLFLSRVADAQRRGYDPEGLKRLVGPVADRFYELISEQWSQRSTPEYTLSKAYSDAIAVLRAQDSTLQKAIGARAVAKQEEPSSWCKTQAGELSEDDVRNLLENTRYVYGAVAVMYAFAGNTEGAIKAYRFALKQRRLARDVNVNGSLGDELYVGERDFRVVSDYYEMALEAIDAQASKAAAFCKSLPRPQPISQKKIWSAEDKEAWDSADKDVCEQLRDRYKRGRLNLKRFLAYLWAQGDMRWPTAQEYAREALDALSKPEDGPLYPCLDDYVSIETKDTYAFVKLSFHAHNYSVDRGTSAYLAELREARWMLEELVSKLQDLQKLQDLPMQDDSPTSRCISHEETNLWLRRIKSHLRLAETLLQ